MVDWASVYYGGKIILTLIGTIAQLVIIFIIWRKGRFKK